MMSVTVRRDGRSLDHATLEEMRRLAVRRVLGGETHAAVAWSLEMYPSNVARWMKTYREKEEAGLASRKATGRSPSLTRKQRAQLYRWIVEKNPRQFKFPFALWTLPLIGQLIEQRFGVVLHKTTIARRLGRLGLTSQRPVRRALTRDEEECRRWAEEEFPAIVRLMRRRQSTLLFQDETGVHEDGPVGGTWGRRGHTPVVQVTLRLRASERRSLPLLQLVELAEELARSVIETDGIEERFVGNADAEESFQRLFERGDL